MRRCLHTSLTRGILTTRYEAGTYHYRECEVKRCKACGAWLGLGPANDTPDALVELRAAEIAADEMGRMMTGPIDHEVLGYILACQAERGFAFDRKCINGSQRAGYLARQIATHDNGDTP